jgi:elongation factor G
VAAKCKPVLLEPLDELEVVTPDDYMGDVLGDLSARRGHILGTEPSAGGTVIRAVVPEAELHTYASSISSMTQGRATFKRRFKGYEEAPTEVAAKVVEEHTREHEEELVHS